MKEINLSGKTVFITGVAGFIGSNLALELLKTVPKITVVGLDNMNDYYDVNIKEWRLKEIEKLASEKSQCSYFCINGDLADKETVDKIFAEYEPDIVVNLAAQAGVRYSITNPDSGMSQHSVDR